MKEATMDGELTSAPSASSPFVWSCLCCCWVFFFFKPPAIVTAFNPEERKKYNKFIGVLHGLKKLRFSTSNTRSVSGDKTTAAQKLEFHCPFSSRTKRCLFKPCPFPFEFQSVSVCTSFIWSYCLPPYLKKLVWIIPKPSSSTQTVTAPPPQKMVK